MKSILPCLNQGNPDCNVTHKMKITVTIKNDVVLTVVTSFKNPSYNVMKKTSVWLRHTQVLMTGEHNIHTIIHPVLYEALTYPIKQVLTSLENQVVS
jgi:hypothetical protein